MDNFASTMDDQYGKKQDVLVDGFIIILQSILMEKRDQWVDTGYQKDFYTSHPTKNWNKDEILRIASKDITKWDTSLCSKWLREFKWTPGLKLTSEEDLAIKNLTAIRNSAKHAANSGHVSRQQFEDNCALCKASLQILKIDPVFIEGILTNARNACVMDQTKLVKLMETPWDYNTQDILGAGAFGVVISAENAVDHSLSAIKLIPIKDWKNNFDHKALREARNLHKLSSFLHENVVKYKSSAMFKFTPSRLVEILRWHSDIYEAKKLQKADSLEVIMMQTGQLITGLYIITEVCGETLRDWLRADHVFDQTEIREAIQISHGLVEGLCYIHQQGVIHRDFRPDNIFFAKQDFQLPIKIGDFGLSIHHKEEIVDCTITRTSPVGHHLYQAPEMRPKQEKDKQAGSVRYGKSVDLFSFGLTISEIFDPQTDLEDKFNTIKYQSNTGMKIQETWPHIHTLILRLTSKDASIRGNLDDQKQESWWHDGISTVVQDTLDNVTQNFQRLGVQQPMRENPGTQLSSPGGFRTRVEALTNFPPSPRPTLQDEKMENLAWWHRGISADEERTGNALNGVNNSTQNPQRPDRTSFSPQQQQKIMSLQEKDIVTMRKFCQRDKMFWTATNIRNFLDLVEPDRTDNHGIGIGSERMDFNRNIYAIVRNRPDLATKENLTSAVLSLGFSSLAGKMHAFLHTTINYNCQKFHLFFRFLQRNLAPFPSQCIA